eukprot:GEMP01006147.1.p1 GENE.GEMP01006147.1~~GEMP01006147.1.p1  ORF type:complete len:771 (+),score=146.70 GEMP01006147.1:80-2392(+)
MLRHSCCLIWSVMVQCCGDAVPPHLNLDYSYKVARFRDPQCQELRPLQVRVTIVSANCFLSELSDTNLLDTNLAMTQSESFEPHGDDRYTVKTFRSHDCTGSIGTEEHFEASKLWLGGGMDPKRSAVPPCACVPAGMVEGLFFSANSWTPFGDLWWIRNGSATWQAKLASTVTKCPWESACEDHGPWCTDAVLRLKHDGAVRCLLEEKCCGSCELFFGLQRVPKGPKKRTTSATSANSETTASITIGSAAPNARVPVNPSHHGARPLTPASLPTELKPCLVPKMKDVTKRIHEAAEVDSMCTDKTLRSGEKGNAALKQKMASFPEGEILGRGRKDALGNEGIYGKDVRHRWMKKDDEDDDEWMWEEYQEAEMVLKCKQLLKRVSTDNCGFGPLSRLVSHKREYEFDLPEPHCHASICKLYSILRTANVCQPLLRGSSSSDGSIFIDDDTFARILIPAMCRRHHLTSRGLIPTTSCRNMSSSLEEHGIAEGDVMPLFERTCSAWVLPAFTDRGFDETRLSHLTPSQMCVNALCSLLQSAVDCVGFQNISFPLPSTRCPLLHVNQTSTESTDFSKLVESREYSLGVVLITQFLPRRYGIPIALICSLAPVELWPFAWDAAGLPPALVLLAILLRKHAASVVGLGIVGTLSLALTIVLFWGLAYSKYGMQAPTWKWSKAVQGVVFMVLCWNDCEREHQLTLFLASTLIVVLFYFTIGDNNDAGPDLDFSDLFTPISSASVSPLHQTKDPPLHPWTCTPTAQQCESDDDTPASQ